MTLSKNDKSYYPLETDKASAKKENNRKKKVRGYDAKRKSENFTFAFAYEATDIQSVHYILKRTSRKNTYFIKIHGR